MPYPIKFVTKPYIRTYLQQTIPNGVASRKTIEGSFFIELLERDSKRFDGLKSCSENNVVATLNVKADDIQRYSNTRFMTGGGWLTRAQNMEYNNYITSLIKRQVRITIISYMQFDPSLKKAIEFTRKLMQIDEQELSDDTLRRDFDRYRKSLESTSSIDLKLRIYNKSK